MKLRTWFLVSIGAAACPCGAFAQTADRPSDAAPAEASASADGGPTNIGDIVVTARKQNERINDVPMSITAATGETLARQGVTQIADLQKISPGFSFQPSQYGNPVYNLRGVGNLGDSVSA